MKLTNQEVLADMLMSARQEKGYSLRKLGEMTGISHTEIAKLEKAERIKPSPAILRSLATALNLDYEQILEAIGYIKSNDFSDNTGLLSDDERNFIADAILEKTKENKDFDFSLKTKEDINNVLFLQSKYTEGTQREVFELVDRIMQYDGETLKKFKSLCEWFIEAETK